MSTSEGPATKFLRHLRLISKTTGLTMEQVAAVMDSTAAMVREAREPIQAPDVLQAPGPEKPQ